MKKIISLLCMLVLISCAASKDRETYKIQLGKKCTKEGTQYSYIWFHTTIGKQQVKESYCR
jgi:hypothetical protein